MPCASSKIKVSSCQNHPTRPETGKNGKTYQNRTLPKKEFFGGKWREYGRNKGKYDEIWKVRKITTGKSQVEYHVGFPKGRNYSRGIGDTLHFSKTKVSSSQKTPSSPRSWKKSVQKPIKPKASHEEFFGGKWREYGRKMEQNMKGWENHYSKELSWIPFLRFPKRRNYSKGIGDALHFLKNQSEQLPEPSNSPRNWKKWKNLSKPNASQKRVLWRDMKGIWEKYEEIWWNMKG